MVLWCPEPILVVRQGLLFALWLSQPCLEQVCSAVVGVEDPRSIFKLWCEVVRTGALPLRKELLRVLPQELSAMIL